MRRSRQPTSLKIISLWLLIQAVYLMVRILKNTKTRKTKIPRSSIIRQLTWNLMYDGKGSWMAFKHDSLAMWKLASEIGGNAGTAFVGPWLIKSIWFLCATDGNKSKVHTCQGNGREIWIFSRSGNYQEIMWCVRKECYFAKISGKCHKILHFMSMKFGYLVMM